jgi:hypothetical protein
VPECGRTKGILEGRPSGRFLGYRVLETREEQAIEDRPASEGNRVQRGSESERKSGKRVSKDWFLPELNCLRVDGETRVIDSEGKLFSTYLHRVNSITVGEPDDRLFAVPPEYQEMPPSKALQVELEAVDPTRYAFLVSSGRLSKLNMEYESSRLVFRPKKLLPVK